MGNSHCPDPHLGSMSYATGNTKSHHTLGKHYLLEFALGHPTWLSELLCEQELLSLHWDPIVLLQARPVECTIPGMKHAPLKQGRRWELRSGISCPQFNCLCLTVLFPPNMYGMHNQVKFLKLPTSLSSRLGGHILFSTGTVTWLLSLFLHWPGGHYTT